MRPLPRDPLRLSPPRAAAKASATVSARQAAGVVALDVGGRPAERQPRASTRPVAVAMSTAVRWLGVYRDVLLVSVQLSWPSWPC